MATTKEEMVTLEDAKEQVRRVCVRLGLLNLSVAKTLVKELGEKKGKQLILKAIKDFSTRIGEEAKAIATAQGLDNNPVNFKSDLPLYGMHEGGEAGEVSGEKRRRVYGLVMGRLWK